VNVIILHGVVSFDQEVDQSSNQVSADHPPAHQGNAQKIIEDTVPPIKRPEIADDDRRNRYQAKDDKWRVFIFSEQFLQTLIISFKYLHQGQYFIQTSWALPQPGQLSLNTAWHSGQTSHPDSTCSEQPGHGPDKADSGGTGLTSSMQMK
jgi:hypothetical protein